MPPIFDSVSSGLISSGNLSVSFLHTVSGENTIGHISVVQQNDPSANRITGVTWNGVAMSLVRTSTDSFGNSIYLFELVAPTTGSIVVSRTGTTNSAWCNAISHSNSSQTGQPDSSNFGSTTTTSLSVSTTTVLDNTLTIFAVFDSDGGVISASTNSVQRSAITPFVKLFEGSTPVSPPGAFSMSVTRGSGTSAFFGIVLSIAPFLPGPPFRFENLPGVVFNSNDKQTIYAERLNNILERLEVLEP